MATTGISALLTQGARADLIKMQAGAKSDLKSKLCHVIDSSSSTENLPWLGQVPAMTTSNKGEGLITDQLSEASYTATNGTYRSGIRILASDMEDDQTGGIKIRISQMLQRGMQLDDKLVIDEVNGSTAAYNGQAFFSNSHPARGVGGAAFDNLLAGTGTTTAQVATDFGTGLSTLAGFLDEAGEPINEGGLDHIVVVAPFGVRKPMLEALEDSGHVNAQAQVSGLKVDIHFSPRMDSSDTNDWCMYAVGLQKPYYFFDRKPLTLTSTDESSDTFIKEGAHIFAAERRAVCVPGNPALGVKFVNA